MYLNDLRLEYDGFHRLDSPRDRPLSNQKRSYNAIDPWGNDEKILGNLRPLGNFNETMKNNLQNIKASEQQEGQTHNFIESPQKGKRNRSNLGKFQKSSKNNNFYQIHLNMSKIEFKQYQQKSLFQDQNQNLFKTNPKINVKNFSSMDNNFFIKSYFFPNNLKSPNRIEDSQSLDRKIKKQYQKIKEIQAPTFLAIKSVDLKEKFMLQQNGSGSDQMNQFRLENEDFYSTYRTISVLSSRKKSRKKVNKSMHENYQIKKLSDNQFKTYNKTIQSTKQSSKQISDSLRQRYKMVIEEKAKRDKLSESNEIILTRSSLIKRNPDNIVHSEETKITQEKEQTTPKTKKANLSKERQTRIDRLKKLKSRSQHQNLMQSLTPFLQPKSIFLSNKKIDFQNLQSKSIDKQNQRKQSQSFRNRIQGSKKIRNQLTITDQPILDEKIAFSTINKSLFLLKDNKGQSLRMK